MRGNASRFLLFVGFPLLVSSAFVACSSGNHAATTSTTSSTGGAGGTGGGGTGGMEAGTTVDPTAVCQTLALASRAWSAGPYGTHRGDVAADFSIPLADGTTWGLQANYSGCESYVFFPDTIPLSQVQTTTSVWAATTAVADLEQLIKLSPKNVHYFFYSGLSSDTAATTSLQAMSANITAALAKVMPSAAAYWQGHLHVVGKRAGSLGGWLATALTTHGAMGLSIDRLQKIRGAGDLSDVTRMDPNASSSMWPFEENVSYLAYYPQYFNAENDIQVRLDAENATVVDLWKGDTLMEQATTTVTLPDAATMAGFDTLEVEVTQQCPDPDQVEMATNNCGAWDYIANLNLADDLGDGGVAADGGADGGTVAASPVEIARFITSYHRETHWVEDISEMLPLLASGGQHSFLWSFAPSWNTQPTATFLSLRLSNQKKGMRPTSATYLFSGGDFGSAYNTGRQPATVPIPATARKVELWVIVTGHGGGTNNCSEFCDHEHTFTVNGTPHLKDFPNAGTENECMPNVTHGMSPNQGGTWWYGRGGWCPGQQVDPWVVDVTADVTPGQTATITYEGTYLMATPPDGSGNIDLISYLVVHE